jgi:O-antigen ligase
MMFSKKQIAFAAFILAVVFHFLFYFNAYGTSIDVLSNNVKYILAFASILLIAIVYLTTYWRMDFKGKASLRIFDLLVLCILVNMVRSLLQIDSVEGFKGFFRSSYMALSLFPVLFLLIGVNPRYFYSTNKLLTIYIVAVGIFSLFFLGYFELQIFLLMPIFYIILTIPLRTPLGRLYIILISASVLIVSMTNRAGILRILISYSILAAYYIIAYLKIDKKLMITLVFLILMLPPAALFLAARGQSIFQMTLGENDRPYSQMDPYADTRTFLYQEVFQDLRVSKSFVFGKGLNAGYHSESFETFNRVVVEVGFLQILLKTGIVGFILYVTVIVTAIIKSLKKSRNTFMKSLGLLLASYIIMLFLENVVAYNLLNVIIWVVIGMCHSEELLNKNDNEIKTFFRLPYHLYHGLPG